MDLNVDKCIHCPGNPPRSSVGDKNVCLGCGGQWKMVVEYKTEKGESCEDCGSTSLLYFRDGGTRECRECRNRWYGPNSTIMKTQTVTRVQIE